MSRAISIQDIAREAGVSHTTVSRALHDNPLISLEVRERIQRLAQEMGYTPNAVAQSLKGQRTNSIGLVVTTIADPFLGRVVRGIEEVAQNANLSVFLSTSYSHPDREMEVIEIFHRRRVDGIIVAAANLTDPYLNRIARMHIPVVLINQQAEVEMDRLHTVSVDDYQGARQAVEHLIALGHTAIGYLGAGNRPRSNRLRLSGYRDALAAAGLKARAPWIAISSPEHRYHSDDVRDGQALLPGLLEAGVSAVFCYNDLIAVGALLAARSHGLAVPAQLSVVGFDDIETSQFVSPALTTVHQPKLSLGKKAMEMLLDLLAEQPVEDQILPTDLIVRASTARPPAGGNQPTRSTG